MLACSLVVEIKVVLKDNAKPLVLRLQFEKKEVPDCSLTSASVFRSSSYTDDGFSPNDIIQNSHAGKT